MIISNWVEKKLDENLRKSREAFEAEMRETRKKRYEKNHHEGFKQGYQEAAKKAIKKASCRVAPTNASASNPKPTVKHQMTRTARTTAKPPR